MTLLEAYTLRYASSNLKTRATVAIAKVALDILKETPPVQARVDWAKGALLNTQDAVERVMWGVIGNAAILGKGESATDAEVIAAVVDAVNLIAV